MTKITMTLIALALAASMATGCKKKAETSEGPMESAGEEMDEAGDDAEDAVEEAGDDIEEATD